LSFHTGSIEVTQSIQQEITDSRITQETPQEIVDFDIIKETLPLYQYIVFQYVRWIPDQGIKDFTNPEEFELEDPP